MTALNCENCLLRQFDSDCAAGEPLPTDVAAHLAACATCQREWQQWPAVDATLRAALQADVPASVYRLAYQAAVAEQEAKPWRGRRWFRWLYAVLGGAAAAQLWLIVPYTAAWPWLAIAAFVIVATAMFLSDFYDECQLPAV